jgi:hypothetical protein
VLDIIDPSNHSHWGGRFFNRIKISTAIGISTIPMVIKAGVFGLLLAEDCGTEVPSCKADVSVSMVDWSVESSWVAVGCGLVCVSAICEGGATG